MPKKRPLSRTMKVALGLSFTFAFLGLSAAAWEAHEASMRAKAFKLERAREEASRRAAEEAAQAEARAAEARRACLSAETWVRAALRTPTTQWRWVVDAVGINEIASWQLIVQVNSAWLSTPRGVRLQFIADIDELVQSHAPKCRAVYWDRNQNRVAARGFDGTIELLTE